MNNQLNLFGSNFGKGSGEWKLASAVLSDRPGMFRVSTPVKPNQPRYGTVVPIRRYRGPSPLFPSHA